MNKLNRHREELSFLFKKYFFLNFDASIFVKCGPNELTLTRQREEHQVRPEVGEAAELGGEEGHVSRDAPAEQAPQRGRRRVAPPPIAFATTAGSPAPATPLSAPAATPTPTLGRGKGSNTQRTC